MGRKRRTENVKFKGYGREHRSEKQEGFDYRKSRKNVKNEIEKWIFIMASDL